MNFFSHGSLHATIVHLFTIVFTTFEDFQQFSKTNEQFRVKQVSTTYKRIPWEKRKPRGKKVLKVNPSSKPDPPKCNLQRI